MKLAGKTDVGRVRQENQDDYRAGELPGGAVWALVCDGMGGAKGGREASQGACNVIEQVFQEQYAQCGAGQEGAFLKKLPPRSFPFMLKYRNARRGRTRWRGVSPSRRLLRRARRQAWRPQRDNRRNRAPAHGARRRPFQERAWDKP